MGDFWITSLFATIALATVVKEVTCCRPGHSETLLTFNAALTPFAYGFEERRTPVVEAIKEQAKNVDFLCLQEFWYEKDVKSVVEALESDFPYHFSAIHSDVGQLRSESEEETADSLTPGLTTIPCTVEELTEVSTCLALNCLSASDQRDCATTQCGDSLYSVSQDCRTCISFSASSVTDVATCADVTEEYNRMNGPGLVVLSRKPLRSVEYVNFNPDQKVLVERGYIHAKVGKKPDYVCTHFTSVFSDYYEKELTMYSSYEEQQAAEIDKVATDFPRRPHVLLGDINTGPARNEEGATNLTARVPDNYDKLTSLGYKNPYLDNKGPCTYCPSENGVLQAEGSSHDDTAIDFVMTRRLKSDVTGAQRVLDSPDTLLSDHYGVQVDICVP